MLESRVGSNHHETDNGLPMKIAHDSELSAPPGDVETVIETHGLTKRFGDRVAVNNVDLSVPRASAFGFVGPNGAGKTTLIRAILGLTHLTSGTVRLLGYTMPENHSRALARVGAVVEEPLFHIHLTGRENLEVVAAALAPTARGGSRGAPRPPSPSRAREPRSSRRRARARSAPADRAVARTSGA